MMSQKERPYLAVNLLSLLTTGVHPRHLRTSKPSPAGRTMLSNRFTPLVFQTKCPQHASATIMDGLNNMNHWASLEFNPLTPQHQNESGRTTSSAGKVPWVRLETTLA